MYKKNLGQFYGIIDENIRHPQLMLDRIRHPQRWMGHIDYDRVGSKWSDDTKLGFTTNEKGNLEVIINLNFNSSDEEIRTKSEKAAEDFEKEANTYFNSKQ